MKLHDRSSSALRLGPQSCKSALSVTRTAARDPCYQIAALDARLLQCCLASLILFCMPAASQSKPPQSSIQQPSADRPAPCPYLQHAAFVSCQRSRGIQEVATILVCSSVVALAYNVVLSLTIRKPSSTRAAVLGIAKTLALLSASAVLLGEA